MTEEIKKYLETNDNENTTIQNLSDAAKTALRGKFVTIQSYLKKQEKSQINNLTLHLKQLEKEEQTKPKVSRRKEIIKIRVEINEIETEKTIAEKINKTDKLLTRLIKKKRERTQVNKIQNEKGEVRTHTAEILKIIRDYYEQLYANKMDNLEEMNKFLERYNLPGLNQEEIGNMNRPNTRNKIETVIKNLPTYKFQDKMASQENSIKHLEKS